MDKFLDWLSPHSFDPKQKHTFKTKHPGTGDWLLQTREFSEWVKAVSSQLLWCHGKPGAGKSVLASHVINHVQQNHVGADTGLCFAYFSFTELKFQNLTLLIALLLKQLCQQHGKIPEKLMKVHQPAKKPADVIDTDLFTTITQPYQKIFIVIDGLDECPEESRSAILDFIVEVLRKPDSNIQVFVSSRKESDISARFKRLNAPAIELETGKITPDIQAFVRHEALRLRNESSLRVRDDALFTEIIESLVKMSDGMFLWVSLQLQQLCRTSRSGNDEKLRQVLRHLPRGLAAMYTRIFDEISEGDEDARKVALECFRWMLYAKQSPSLEVLRVSVALLESPDTTTNLSARLPPGEYIVEECRHLLQLSKLETFSPSIAPIHFSFLEYLENLPSDKLQGDFWTPLTEKHNAESILAVRCMEWLLFALPEDWTQQANVFDADTHLSYPTRYFDKHAKCAVNGSGTPPTDLMVSVNRFLNADAGKLDCLVHFRLMRMPLGRISRVVDKKFSRNYLLWTSDLFLIPGLDRKWTELEIPKYALHLAVWYRPGELQRLLSNGHYVDEVDKCRRTPLSYACEKGCLISVNALLLAGAKVDAHSWQLSPLGLAIMNNHLELTKILLMGKADVELLPDIGGQIPLMMAASLEMVQLLCETHEFDIDATNYAGRSVLSHYVGGEEFFRYLSSASATQILGYLLSRGADLYVKSKAGMSLVDYAACGMGGHEPGEPLKFLLERDPKLTDKEAHEWTALHWACRQGNVQAVKTLLEHGCEVKKVTTLYPTQSWTPYDILIHYCGDSRGFDESITYELSQLQELRTGVDPLPGVQIDYSSLKAIEGRRSTKCSLCEMYVDTGFFFYCEICSINACLMCNHARHNDQRDHALITCYMFKTAHPCTPSQYQEFHEVSLPQAFDLRLPDWRKWFQETKRSVRDKYHEELRSRAAVQNPLWSDKLKIERMIDRCESLYGVEVVGS